MVEHLQRQTEAQEAGAHAILYKTSLLTSEQWQTFRVLFETVHKGYLERLEQKIPDLTPAELRLMTLATLGLSQKDMAITLGHISPLGAGEPPPATQKTAASRRRRAGRAGEFYLKGNVQRLYLPKKTYIPIIFLKHPLA